MEYSLRCASSAVAGDTHAYSILYTVYNLSSTVIYLHSCSHWIYNHERKRIRNFHKYFDISSDDRTYCLSDIRSHLQFNRSS